jgi:hypothetical protein
MRNSWILTRAETVLFIAGVTLLAGGAVMGDSYRLTRECRLLTQRESPVRLNPKRLLKFMSQLRRSCAAEWTIIAPLLPGAEGRKNGRPRPDDRKVFNGIFFVIAHRYSLA